MYVTYKYAIMPTPLFPYTWQYNNQPIEVLAEEVLNIISNGNTPGPVNTANYIPVSNGLAFEDSVLNTKDIANNDILETIFPTVGNKGFLFQPFVDKYTFGECDPLATTGFRGALVVDNFNGYISMGGVGLTGNIGIGVSINGIELGGNVSLTAGSSSGAYLEVYVNNVLYKLELLNP